VSAIETSDTQYEVKRWVTVEWPDGDGPEVSERGHDGRAVKVIITYRCTNRSPEWKGTASLWWAWTVKGGKLGAQLRESWSSRPDWVASLVAKHLPQSFIEVNEIRASGASK